MTRLIMPIILVGVSIAVFFVLTNPVYNEIIQLRLKVASYDEAMNNSKMLENERDKLTAKYNSIDPENLVRLEKFLPKNIDNIRLILEIEQVALPYGMVLRDVKYNTTPDDKDSSTASGEAGVVKGGAQVDASPKDYGIWDLEFSTIGTYNNFLNFVKDLERNLRIVDISAIQFTSNTNISTSSNLPQSYKYDFKIKTYWLKN